jgi:hypothetical protein
MTQPGSSLSYALQSIIAYMERQYYLPIEQLCLKAKEDIIEIHGGDNDQTASLYTTLSKKLLEYVTDYVRLRRVLLKGFAEEGHAYNCDAHCEQHLLDGRSKIQELFVQLNAIIEPPLSESAHPGSERALRLTIRDLDEQTREMFYLEQTSLLPKIKTPGPATA